MLVQSLMLSALLFDIGYTKTPITEVIANKYESIKEIPGELTPNNLSDEKIEITFESGEKALTAEQVEQANKEATKLLKAAQRENIVNIAMTKNKQTEYVFGGGRIYSHAYENIFDCSSFIHFVYRLAGIDLGNIQSVSTETLNKTGKRIAFDQINIGDLIFFDTYKKDGHVGIWLGDGKWIGCQTSSGVSIETMDDPYWSSKFSGHVRDILQ